MIVQTEKTLIRKSGIRQAGFTLLEILLVITLMVVIVVVLVRPEVGSFRYWEQEGEIKKISELITFLYYQALSDGENYRLEFSLDEEPHAYRVGQLAPDGLGLEDGGGDIAEETEEDPAPTYESGTLIAQEIEQFLHPQSTKFTTMVPPQNLPSFAEPMQLPIGMTITDIRTIRGDYTTSSPEDRPHILFSPRGFVEFAVIHLRMERNEDAEVTLLVNPFTGVVDIYREYKQFEWSYGKKQG